MFPRLALLPVGLFIIWCFVCQRWYVCHIKQKCGTQTEQPPPPPPVDNRPLVFQWSDPTAITRSTFEAFRDSILKGMKEGQLLEITGLYFEGEPAPPGFANMGLARGEQVKQLFAKLIPADRIVVTSEKVAEPADARAKPFEAARFRYKDAAPPPPDMVECIRGTNSLTLLFPYGKAQREVDLKIEECLKELIEHLKKTDETVHITGHTDSAGSIEFNQGLGMRRAEHIKGILVGKGIAESRITVESKGETEPVASNDTEEGSRLNRRAVLVINKK